MNDPYLRAPHRPAAPADAHSPHAALLIDFDNVTMGIRSNLGQELRKLLDSDMIRGKVSVQRAYADWRRYPQYIASLSEASIDLIFAPAYGSTKKNATDIRLAIDALEIVFIRPEIGTFILLSGDSDFSSLVLKLKEYGKYVIGVGIQESSSDLLVQNCDEYYSYNSLSGLTSASEMANIEKHDPWELASKAIRRMTERGDVMRSDRFKQVMLELDPSFDEKSIGFSKFNRFLTESASRGILELKKASNGQYEVAIGPRIEESGNGGGGGRTAASTPPAESSKQESDAGRGRRRSREDRGRAAASGRSRRSRSGGGDRADMSVEAPPAVDEDRLRAAYTLLQSVVRDKAGASGHVRDSEVKRQMVERDPSFDEGALGFRKFSRFLRQAHDEEVINLERTAEGNFTISVVEDSVVPTMEPVSDDGDGERKSGDRGRGRGRRDRRGEGRRRDAGKEAEDASDSGDAADDAVPEGAAGDDEPSAEPVDEGAPSPDARPPETREEEPEGRSSAPARSPLAGRKRRTPQPKATGGVVPGPVDAGTSRSRGDSEAKAEASEAARPKPSKRTMGQFRRGSRGSTAPTNGKAGEPKSESGPEGRTDSGSESVGEAKELVERMARGYQGVGRRTAERLVDEFGDRVLEVIDNEPDKIEDVLPKGRAQAVIDGRRAELEEDGE